MVRTKADAGCTRVAAAKAPRKVVSSGGNRAGSSSSGSPFRAGSTKDRYSGGNAYNPQPIPQWQKGIGEFFKAGTSQAPAKSSNEEVPSSTDDAQQGTSNESPLTTPGKEVIENENLSTVDENNMETADDNKEESFEKNGLISDEDD